VKSRRIEGAEKLWETWGTWKIGKAWNRGIGTDNFDIDQLRERLHKMTDKQLLEFGKNVRYLCGPEANFGKPPLQAWSIQLEEAKQEWRRRHPKLNDPKTEETR
jgi:hypothetical protein